MRVDFDRRTPAEQRAARESGRYSTAGLDLAIIERRTHHFREELARKHGREAAKAAARAALCPPYLNWATGDGTFGVPFLGPWWDSGAEGLASWGTWQDGEHPLPAVLKRVRRRRGRLPRAELVPASLAFSSQARWHEGRAKGQRLRCDNCGHCGEGKIQVSCSCGDRHECDVRCGVIRLCFRCMTKRTHHQRRRWMRAYRILHRFQTQRGRYLRTNPGGRWTDKHLVLTAPHVLVKTAEGHVDEAATAMRRIELVLGAWKHFARSLQRWLREHKGQGAQFYRCFEWTIGADGCGHPHLHVWIHGPWLPVHDSHFERGKYVECTKRKDGKPCRLCSEAGRGSADGQTGPRDDDGPVSVRREHDPYHEPSPGVRTEAVHRVRHRVQRNPVGRSVRITRGVRSWWAAALAKEGVAIGAEDVNLTLRSVTFRAIEFVREVQKPNGRIERVSSPRIIASEESARALAKYFEPWTIAASDPVTGRRATETVLAAVYMALEGKRMSQGSRGFLAMADAEIGEPCCRECGQVAARKVTVTPWDRGQLEAASSQREDWGPPHQAQGNPAQPESEIRILDAAAFSALLRDAAEDIRTRGWRKPRDPWAEPRQPGRK